MDTGLQELKTRLIQTDQEFSRLAREHSDYERRLEQLLNKHFLTDSEQLEEVTLKKKKLSLKDQMERILQRHKKDCCVKP
ncbi:MAG: DUF465 domain-containing protein [Acidobacteria bacterium]|nr:DUF465 domain-containing protein [Acidobacteriota bacterium]